MATHRLPRIIPWYVVWSGSERRVLTVDAGGPDGVVDWWCSDIVCYPDRLLGLVTRWLATGRVRNLVCTLKFQGRTDHEVAARFAAIPGAQLFHLDQNKHELTCVVLDATAHAATAEEATTDGPGGG